jgi:hypothetical protein
MKITLRKEVQLEFDMFKLMLKCVWREEWYNKNKTERPWVGQYENLEELVRCELELLCDIDLCDYDNQSEVITTVTKSLLNWCLENNFTNEYNQLIKLG